MRARLTVLKNKQKLIVGGFGSQPMVAWGFLVMVTVTVVSVATIAVASTVSGGSRVQRMLTLERAFPVEERVEIELIKARDRARHSRILQGFAGGVVNFPVDGTSDPDVFGLYFTKVRLGSPPREFNVQIDTGSDILWVTCSSCTDCPQNSGLGIPLNFFDAAASSTGSPVSCADKLCASLGRTESAECSVESNQCRYTIKYEDGSGTTGFYATDLLYFDTIFGTSLMVNSSAPIVFGCATSLFGDLIKSDGATDGIFGFGQQGFSVISQLSSYGITPKVFSHCLKGEGSGGGILVLGEILDPRIVYTPLVPLMPHYNLYLQSVAVNGQLLSIDPSMFTTSDNQGTIVDSGTTLAYLVEGAYDPFVAAVTAAVSPSVEPIISKGNQCYLVSTSVAEMFPPVAFNFAGGASLVLRPVDYLVHMGFADGAAMWCMGFIKVQNQGRTILGDLVLKDKIFVYDLARQRIGWADYDCSSSVNVSITSTKNEYVNSGQMSVGSGSSSCMFFKIMHKSDIPLPWHIQMLIGCLLLNIIFTKYL